MNHIGVPIYLTAERINFKKQLAVKNQGCVMGVKFSPNWPRSLVLRINMAPYYPRSNTIIKHFQRMHKGHTHLQPAHPWSDLLPTAFLELRIVLKDLQSLVTEILFV